LPPFLRRTQFAVDSYCACKARVSMRACAGKLTLQPLVTSEFLHRIRGGEAEQNIPHKQVSQHKGGRGGSILLMLLMHTA